MTTTWQDEILRHKERLAADLVPRELAVALTCLLFATFLPAGLVAAVYAICLASEVVEFAATRRFAMTPTRPWQALILVNSAVALSAFSLLGLAAAGTGDPYEFYAGALALVGALLNVATARAIHLPLGIVSGLPPAAALLWVSADRLASAPAGESGPLVALLSALALVGYFAATLRLNHHAENRLVGESRRAADASQAKSRFLAEMSHEIRTPLNAILGMSQGLQAEPPPAGVVPLAAAIETAARSLQMMVEDVLDLASAEEGRLANRPLTVVVRQELAACLQALALRSPQRPMPAAPDLGAETPELARFDPALLRKLVLHLAAGTDPGRTMRLSCDAAGPGWLRITLGPLAGMASPATIPQPAQAPASRAQATQALGALGQTLVERICALTGATVSAARDAAGDTVIGILMPVGPVADLPSPEAVARTRRIRALVVDDIATNRFVVVQLLRILDIEAVEAASGPEALAALDRSAFDVVLLDMNMPGMDGAATFRAIRTAGRPWSALPVVALTADALPDQREQHLALGLDGYVPKPVDKRLLWAEIFSATSRGASGRAPDAPA